MYSDEGDLSNGVIVRKYEGVGRIAHIAHTAHLSKNVNWIKMKCNKDHELSNNKKNIDLKQV